MGFGLFPDFSPVLWDLAARTHSPTPLKKYFPDLLEKIKEN